MKDTAVLVPPKILSELMDIWDDSEINPMQYQLVLAEVERRGSTETLQWLRNNRKFYLQAVEGGFAPDHE